VAQIIHAAIASNPVTGHDLTDTLALLFMQNLL
jgi:hypothetical protein